MVWKMPDRYLRGDVYTVVLDPTEGHEQAGTRPCLIISSNRMNVLPIEMCVVLPITSRVRADIPLRITMVPPEGGLQVPSQILCEQVRSVSHGCIRQRWGAVHPSTMSEVQRVLRLILALEAGQ